MLPEPFIALVLVDSYPAESWGIKCPTAGGTEICLCIEVVQRSHLYFGFDHNSPISIDCKLLSDSGLRNGLAKEIHGQLPILALRLTTRVLGERVIVVGGLPFPRVQMVIDLTIISGSRCLSPGSTPEKKNEMLGINV